MKITQGSVVAEPGEHIVLLGPIRGTVTTQDGTVYDVSDVSVGTFDEGHRDEITHLVSLRYAAEGHPHHEADKPFFYEPPPDVAEKFADYEPHPENATLVASVDDPAED